MECKEKRTLWTNFTKLEEFQGKIKFGSIHTMDNRNLGNKYMNVRYIAHKSSTIFR